MLLNKVIYIRGIVNLVGADLLSRSAKVYLFLERSCAILSSLKIMSIFNNKSAGFVLISDDVVLKICNHNFEWTEDHTTVFLKWTDFRWAYTTFLVATWKKNITFYQHYWPCMVFIQIKIFGKEDLKKILQFGTICVPMKSVKSVTEKRT